MRSLIAMWCLLLSLQVQKDMVECVEAIHLAQTCCLVGCKKDIVKNLVHLRIETNRLTNSQFSASMFSLFRNNYDAKAGACDDFNLVNWKTCNSCTMLVLGLQCRRWENHWKMFYTNPTIQRRTRVAKLSGEATVKTGMITQFLNSLKVQKYVEVSVYAVLGCCQ